MDVNHDLTVGPFRVLIAGVDFFGLWPQVREVSELLARCLQKPSSAAAFDQSWCGYVLWTSTLRAALLESRHQCDRMGGEHELIARRAAGFGKCVEFFEEPHPADQLRDHNVVAGGELFSGHGDREPARDQPRLISVLFPIKVRILSMSRLSDSGWSLTYNSAMVDLPAAGAPLRRMKRATSEAYRGSSWCIPARLIPKR